MAEVEIDAKQLNRIAEELIGFGKKEVTKAMSKALNDTISKTRTDMKRETVAVFAVKSSAVHKSISVKKSYKDRLQARATSTGKAIALIHFPVDPKKPPKKRTNKLVSVKIKKSDGYKVIKRNPSAFVQKMGKAINVWAREGKERFPVKRLHDRAIPQMISNEGVMNNIIESTNKQLDKRVEHHINQTLNKIKGGNK